MCVCESLCVWVCMGELYCCCYLISESGTRAILHSSSTHPTTISVMLNFRCRCLCVYLSVSPFLTFLQSVCLPVYFLLCWLVCLTVCPSVCQPVYLTVCSFVCLSDRLSVCRKYIVWSTPSMCCFKCVSVHLLLWLREWVFA